MSQVTIYLPDGLAELVKREAERAGTSVSAFLAQLAARAVGAGGWPAGFAALYGSWSDPFPEPHDPPPEVRDTL